MILVATLILIAAGLYHRSAMRVLNAVCVGPYAALRLASEFLTSSATSLQSRALDRRNRGEGGTLTGALLMTLVFLVLFGSDLEMAAVTWGPLLGFELGPLAKFATPSLIASLTAIAVAAPWIVFELADRERLLSIASLRTATRFIYAACAVASFVLAVIVMYKAAVYRTDVAASAATVPAAPLAEADPVAAALNGSNVTPAVPTVSPAERSAYRWVFQGLGLATILLLVPAWHFGPQALVGQLCIALLVFAGTVATVFAGAVRLAHGMLGWLYEIARGALELGGKITITLTRPLLTFVRHVHQRERDLPSGRVWVLALTSWREDVEVGNEPVGAVELTEGVAAPMSRTSSFQNEEPASIVPGAAPLADEQSLGEEVWDAYPARGETTNSEAASR